MRSVKLNYRCVYFTDFIFDGQGDELLRTYPLGQDDPIREVIIVVDQKAISQLLLYLRQTSGNFLFGCAHNVYDDYQDNLAYPDESKSSKKSEAKRMCRLIKKLVCNDRTANLNNLTEGKASIHTLSRFVYFLRSESPDDYHTVVAESIPIKSLVVNIKHDPKHYFVKVQKQFRSGFVKSGNNYVSNYRTLDHIDSYADLSTFLLSVCYNYNMKLEEKNG